MTTAGCGIILFVVFLFWQEPGTAAGTRDWLRILSNAALAPGILLTGIGLLVRIADENVFDGVKYAFGSLITHMRGDRKRHATYYDYIHREKPREKGACFSLLVSGLFFLIVAIGLTVLYYYL